MMYLIDVHTGDERFAGTNANIFVQLIGERGKTGEVRLNPYISGNAFERNHTDKLMVPHEDVGDIYMLNLRSDCAYNGPDWLCDTIKIRHEQPPYVRQTTTFRIGKWIRDKKTRTYAASSGYVTHMTAQENWIEVMGAARYLTNPTPNPSTEELTVHQTWKASMSYEQVVTKSLSQELNLEVGIELSIDDIKVAAKEAVNTTLKDEFKQTTKYQLDETVEITHKSTYELPPKSAYVLQEVWSYCHNSISMRLGDTILEGLDLISDCRFSGFVQYKVPTLLWKGGTIPDMSDLVVSDLELA